MEANKPALGYSPCTVCGRLNETETDNKPFPYADLTGSVGAGCETCSIILKGIEKVLLASTGPEPKSAKLTINGIIKDKPSTQVTVHYERPPIYRIGIDFYSTADSVAPAPWSNLQAKPHLSNSSVPQVRFDVALQWLRHQLKECESNHSKCIKKLQEKKISARRFLDLENHLQDSSIRLIEPTENLAAPYMTLSYCWGHQIPITTTKANIGQRKQEIKWRDLPKTFKDAVKITRALEVRYLWIDSLCIIQDNNGDWETESSKMAAIYSGSYLTISAVSSRDSNGGCIVGEEAPEYFSIDCSIKGEEQSKIYVRQALERASLSDAHGEVAGSHNPLSIPLLSRSWAYQERILSPRIIHFHKWEIFWECKSCLNCQCGAKHSKYRSSDKTKSVVRPELEDDVGNTLQELLEVWGEVVSSYSQLILTDLHDRLPALAGIASLFSTHLKEQDYLAGIWKGLLPWSLLWYTNPNQASIPNAVNVYRAPSWSWAAIDSPAKFYSSSEPHKDFEIIDAWCQVPGNNSYGRVVDGKLTIKGLFLESPTLRLQRHLICLDFDPLGLHFRFYPDDIDVCRGYVSGKPMPWTVVWVAKPTWNVDVTGSIALVLKASETISGTYVRVGLAEDLGLNRPDETIWCKEEPMKIFAII